MASASRSPPAPPTPAALPPGEGVPLIAFLDVETSMPKGEDQRRELLEFGVIIVCPHSLVEVTSYSTLVRPADPASARWNGGLTWDALSRAPLFRDVAKDIYRHLNGRVWAGHNIQKFDSKIITAAFNEIGEIPPKPSGMIDTLILLRQQGFDNRAGDMKLDTLGKYFGLDKQTHRSLDDVRRNIEVLKNSATIMFLEPSLREGLTVENVVEHAISSGHYYGFLEPNGISIECIKISDAPHRFGQSTSIKHRDWPLQLCCAGLKVKYGVNKRFLDNAGRPKINIVVEIDEKLRKILEFCDDLATKLFKESDNSNDSKWMPLIKQDGSNHPQYGYVNCLTVRLNIPTDANSNAATYSTSTDANSNAATYSTSTYICQREPSGNIQKLSFSNVATELDSLFVKGSKVDAFFSVEAYNNNGYAGIRLVAKRLISTNLIY